MTTITQELATPGQIKQITRVAADAVEKAVADYFKGCSVTKEGAQRVIANPDFAVRIREPAILALADLSATDKFKDEERPSSYGYLSGYEKPKSVAEQLKILCKQFPMLPKGDLVSISCPEGAEGVFVNPHWSLVAKTYPEAVSKLLDALSKAYGGKLFNYRRGEIDASHLRESDRKAAFIQKLRETQKSDMLQVPAQFGIRHRGRSVRRAREVILNTVGEFGLGAWENGIMLLTHPTERLRNYDDLWIDCAGDEWKWSGESEFSFAPIFYDGRLRFDAHFVGYAYEYYGSSSGFLPQ